MKEDLSVQPSNAKLDKFKEIVLNDASYVKEKVLEEIKLEKEKAIQAAEIEIANEIKTFIDKETEKINNRLKQALSKENFDGKRALLLKRDQILNNVFSEVKQKLSDFCKSDDYKQLIVEKTKQAKQKFSDKDIEIFLRQADFAFENELKSVWGEASKCTVLASNNIEYGGVMFSFPQINLIIDETFDSKISQLQRDFIKISGLYFG